MHVMLMPSAANLLQIEFYFGPEYITGILPYLENGATIKQLQQPTAAVGAWKETDCPLSLQAKVRQRQTCWNVKGSLLILHGI